MTRIAEIEQRLNAIKSEMDAEGADIQALSDETDALLEERKGLIDAMNTRQAMLDKIAKLPTPEKKEDNKMEERNFDIASAEYRSAWLKNIRGIELNEVEQRAMTTAAGSAGSVIPTTTSQKIIEKVHQYAPLLDKIDLYHVSGYLVIPAEGTTNDAAKHTEGAAITASNDTLGKVSLGAFEVTKLITISKSVETMSIDAFEAWLVRKLAQKIAEKLTALIINGSGTGEAEGINKITWGATNSVTVAKAASLTEANVLDVISMLNGGYDPGAEWLMSKKTFFVDFYPLMDKAKNITVAVENGKYFIAGYPVTMDERVTDHEAFLGNIGRGYAGNLAENVTVTPQFVARENAYDFLGAAMFDGKVQATEAFVKVVKATS